MTDAHNHLHQLPDPDRVLQQSLDAGLTCMVVNGTSEQDWSAVAQLTARHSPITIPAFGLHPWKIPHRSPDWLKTLEQFLIDHPHAHLGECGLDRWKKPYDLDDQINCLRQQIELASRLNRPLTIHCLQAWGPLLELLERFDTLPPFLLHAYSGSTEMVSRFTRLGAYFSFNGYFMHERKTATRETFQHIPNDRLLLETDSPSMLPPERFITHPLPDNKSHPANLPVFLPQLSKLLNIKEEALLEQLEANFRSFNSR